MNNINVRRRRKEDGYNFGRGSMFCLLFNEDDDHLKKKHCERIQRRIIRRHWMS